MAVRYYCDRCAGEVPADQREPVTARFWNGEKVRSFDRLLCRACHAAFAAVWEASWQEPQPSIRTGEVLR